ncbi:MAG TPA: hypothetical protein VNT42_12040 [Sphingomonas sp.]|nr:hypothetical protein [Sphingomonas sp.]
MTSPKNIIIVGIAGLALVLATLLFSGKGDRPMSPGTRIVLFLLLAIVTGLSLVLASRHGW